jgi:hypothetical protein
MKTVQIALYSVVLITFISTSFCQAQNAASPEPDSLRNSTIKVFLDCPYCDFDYIRTEMPYINYVRDRFEPDVHVLITEQSTSGGGTEYTINFIGEKQFAGMEDTLKYYSLINYTDDELRKGLIRTLELGLTRYLARTPLAGYFSINYELKAQPEAVKDRWHHWVFTVSPTVQYYGSSSHSDRQIAGDLGLASSRITYDEKSIIGASGHYSEERGDYLYYSDVIKTILSIQKGWNVHALQVWSIDEHWSVGASGSANGTISNSSRRSKSSDVFVAPTLEYDIFPYSESTHRLLSLDYSIGAEYSYGRFLQLLNSSNYSNSQGLMVLTAGLTITQPWGNAYGLFTNRQYFDNLTHNSQLLNGRLSWRLSEGLFLDIGAQWDRDNGFPRELGRPNRYYYSTRIGFSGVFGSIYNNIVNPRMMFH